MSDQPTEPSEQSDPWSFVTAEEFLGDVDEPISSEIMQDEIIRLCEKHDIGRLALLRRTMILLKGIMLTMPVDASEGLDCVRADVQRFVALPSWREMIVFLLDYTPPEQSPTADANADANADDDEPLPGR